MKWALVSLWISFISIAYGVTIELPPQNACFTGRVTELKWIQETFSKTTNAILSAGPGFGKTDLAKQYAYLHAKNYDFVFWIDANQDLTLQLEHMINCVNETRPDPQKIRFKGIPQAFYTIAKLPEETRLKDCRTILLSITQKVRGTINLNNESLLRDIEINKRTALWNPHAWLNALASQEPYQMLTYSSFEI